LNALQCKFRSNRATPIVELRRSLLRELRVPANGSRTLLAGTLSRNADWVLSPWRMLAKLSLQHDHMLQKILQMGDVLNLEALRETV
jgi:hypothetical protein